MGYLEKVFLGSLLLFALIILFMFGLYFDLGSMLQGSLRKGSSSTGARGYGSSLERLERESVDPEIRVRRTSAPSYVTRAAVSYDTQAAEANFAAIYARVSTVQPPPTLEERQEFKRKQLRDKGYGDPYIEMELGRMNKRPVEEAHDRADELMKQGLYDDAEAMLLELMSELEPGDLMTMQRYNMKLQEVYFESGQLDKYRSRMQEIFALEERILALQAASPDMNDKWDSEAVKLRQQELAQKRSEFGGWFQEYSAYAQETGGKAQLTDSMRSRVKAELLRGKEAGKVSPEDLASALAELDDLENRTGGGF